MDWAAKANLIYQEAESTAACVVVINEEDNSILAITRKDDYHDIGFPGGKIEKNETPKEAAVRECLEETGILVSEESLVLIAVDVGKKAICSTYLAEKIGGNLKGKSKEGLPIWVAPSALIEDTCTYKKYNYNVIKKLIKEGKIQ